MYVCVLVVCLVPSEAEYIRSLELELHMVVSNVSHVNAGALTNPKSSARKVNVPNH